MIAAIVSAQAAWTEGACYFENLTADNSAVCLIVGANE
jgi:hypothetical protein